jgi:glutamate/tyrosine decarboxylase-like PLP-dependent enzyme
MSSNKEKSIMAKNKKASAAGKPTEWQNLVASKETHEAIDRLCDLMGREDPLGTRPSKHRAVALAVHEAIARRTEGRR